MRKRFVSAAIVLVGATAMADPDSTSDRFLNDSPSMMDWGILRLELALQSYGILVHGSVSYDWSRNRIDITRTESVAESVSRSEMEGLCRDWFQAVRSFALIDPETGSLSGPFGYTEFAGYFGHIGFGRTLNGIEEPQALADLDRIFYLQQYFFRRESTGPKNIAVCSGELKSSGFAIEVF